MSREFTQRLLQTAGALAATAILSACAGSGPAASAPSAVRDENEFVTGSRIPQRDRKGVRTMSREELEREQTAGRPSVPAITAPGTN